MEDCFHTTKQKENKAVAYRNIHFNTHTSDLQQAKTVLCQPPGSAQGL